MKYALGNMLNGAGGMNPDGLALDLQFATDKTLTARRGPTPTFSRSSSGTFVNANGLIVGKTEGTTSSITPSTQTIGSQVTVTVASGSVVGWVIGQAISLIVDTDGQDDPDATELWLLGNIVSTTSTQLVFEVTSRTTQAGSASSWTLGYRGPRFDHDPVSPFACRGLLIEEGRINLAARSGEPATWNLNGSSVLNDVTAPDGGVAKNIALGTNLFIGVGLTSGTAATANAVTTVSVFLKKDNNDWMRVQWISGSNIHVVNAWFNIGNGTLGSVSTGAGTPSNSSSSITPYPNGWYRCTISASAPTTDPINGTIITASSNSSFTRVAGANITVWGAQLEAGSFATSYIPTTTSTAARSADVCSITAPNFATFWNRFAGTAIVNVGSSLGNEPRFVSNLVAARTLEIMGSSNIDFFEASGANQVRILSGATYPVKLGLAYAINDYQGAYNGILSGVDTNTGGTIPNATELHIGNLGGTSNRLTGHIQSIRYYKKRLSNAKLQALTA